MTISSGRILGLDVGDRRIGVAVSDPDGHFALPLNSIVRDGHGGEIDRIADVVREDEISAVVVGLPLSLSGESGAQAELSMAFAKTLETRLGLPVHLYDERLSTREANRIVSDEGRGGGRRGRAKGPAPDTDAIAASIILQAYLDARRFRRE
jgi:putative Holliday junction resolvase